METVFLKTQPASRGGAMVGAIDVYDLEGFLNQIEKSPYSTYRVAYVNGRDTRHFKFLSLNEFESLFSLHLERLKPILEYRKGNYYHFKKEVYEKYGILK